jgi:hypothetical protein
MKKNRLFLPPGDREKTAEDLFLFLPGGRERKIKAHLSQSDAAGKFLDDKIQMGLEIDPVQAPGVKTHGREDQFGKTNGQAKDFFIRGQVRPDPDDPPHPGILGPLQGFFEVLDLIQVGMGIDELE